MKTTTRQAALKAKKNLIQQQLVASDSSDTDDDIVKSPKPALDSPAPEHPPPTGKMKPQVMGEGEKKMRRQDFDVQAKMLLDNLDAAFDKKIARVAVHYKTLRLRTRKEVSEMTLGQYLKLMEKIRTGNTKEDVKLQSPDITSSKKSGLILRVSLEKLDPRFLPVTATDKGPSAMSVIASATNNKETFSTPMNRGNNQLMIRKSKSHSMTIRAKFDPNKPVNPLRWPVGGEMALSLQGSPMIGNGVSALPMVNLNIPLQNGKVMAILPHPMADVTLLPGYITEDILKQLKCIEDNISLVRRLCKEQQDPNRNSLVRAGTSHSQ